MPLRANNGKLLTAKFKLVKGREDECCCQTDTTCCGGTCVRPCCRVIVRFTIAADCATVTGTCSGFNYNTFEEYSYPADSPDDCQCVEDEFWGEICDFYTETAQTFIDVDVTDSFGGLTESDTDGDICFAYLTFPEGGRAASEFHFTSRVNNQWTTVGNWFRDRQFTRPAGDVPDTNAKVTLWAPAVLPSSLRLNNTAGGFAVNELVLNGNGGVTGAITVKKLKAVNGVIPADGQITVTQNLDAKDLTVAGELILQGATSALFTGGSVIAAGGKITHESTGRIVFRETSANDGTITSRHSVQIAFRDGAINNGEITGGFPRFVGAAENTGVLTPTNTAGRAAGATFVGSAKNSGTINGDAGFAFLAEQAVLDETTNKFVVAGNYSVITGKAAFYTGAQNHGTVEGVAHFAFGDNYGTVGSALFFTNITSGALGFSGGRSNNYGTVKTVANFVGRLDANTGVAEGAINRPSGCVGQRAWFDSVSVNLGRPNPNNAPTTGGNRIYECDSDDCCGGEELKLPPKRLASTDEETPIDGIDIDFTEDDVTADDLTCEEALLDCRMDFRVSAACRQTRTCHYRVWEFDEPPGEACGVNCFYELKIRKGNTPDGRPIYDYIGFADPLICAGITNIEIIEQCPGGYESNGAPGGTCRQNLTQDQCSARGGQAVTKNGPPTIIDGAFVAPGTQERAQCAEQPCDVCCGPEICSQLILGQFGDISITAADCTRCDNFCVDMTGGEREVSAGVECDPCYNSEGRCYGFNYDTYENYSYPAEGPEDCQCVEDEWWGEICDYYDVVCDAETFVTRGFCGVVIPATDSVLQELAICATNFPRSHRCDFEEFPMALCAGGSFITEEFGDPQALPHAPSLGLSGSFTESFPGGAFGWGYSIGGLNIGQGLWVTPNFCGGWSFSAYKDGRGGPLASTLSVNGGVKTVTACGTCYPESVQVSGAGSKWVTTNEFTGEGERVFFDVNNAEVTFTEGYRCWAGYFGFMPTYFASCVPCSEVGGIDAPRGFEQPPREFLKLPQSATASDVQESSIAADTTESEQYPPPLGPQDLKPVTISDEQIPAHLVTTLTAVRAAHPDKTINVQRFFNGKYVFVAEPTVRGKPAAAFKAAEPKDCLYALDDATGTGTFLSSMLEKIGIKSTPNCACRARAKIMNCRGPEWCAENIDKIIGWLREEATKRKLPFVDLAGKLLVKRAISLSRAAKKKESKNGDTAPHSINP